MAPEDVPSAKELSAAANWNQTEEDWLRIMRLAPGGCRCVDDSGKIVATTTLLPFGTELAWIGMVLTRPEYRRQGFARRLIEDAIASARRLGIGTLKLDATDQGRPLYQALGFVPEQTIERWGRDRDRTVVLKKEEGGYRRTSAVPAVDYWFSEDTAAFGVSRTELLKALSGSGPCSTAPGGYALSRAGRTARYLGPCVASSVVEAQELIAAHLQESEVHWFWDLLPSNKGAVHSAEQFGFSRQRVLWRMRRGEALQNNNSMVYAIAGFELG